MTREVIFAPEALTDLFELYDYIAANSGAERARSYMDRIVATGRNLVMNGSGGLPAPIVGRHRIDVDAIGDAAVITEWQQECASPALGEFAKIG